MKTQFTLLILFAASIGLKAQTYPVDTLLYSGPTDTYINLVILPDGYKNNEMTKFRNDAQDFMDALFDERPFAEYEGYFNVFAIEVPSNESGASHPGTATDVSEPVHPVVSVDNFFGSRFDIAGIHRLLAPTQSGNAYQVLFNQLPNYDQIVMLVNSPHYGGSGGPIATASTNSSSNEIAIHEMGHSFVGLKDEYYAGDQFAAEGINMTQETDPSLVRWKNWYGDQGVGIYQYCCGGNSAMWYRPHQDCKMRALGKPFCAVCVEGIIEEIHDRVSPIESFEPVNLNIQSPVFPLNFSINTIKPNPNTLRIEWQLNAQVQTNETELISLNQNDLVSGQNTLTVFVEDTTELLRVDQHTSWHLYSVHWTIENSSTGIHSSAAYADYEVSVFPNPFSETLNVELGGGSYESLRLEIHSDSGRRVYRKKVRQGALEVIPLGKMNPGNYLLSIHSGKTMLGTRKLVKMN